MVVPPPKSCGRCRFETCLLCNPSYNTTELLFPFMSTTGITNNGLDTLVLYRHKGVVISNHCCIANNNGCVLFVFLQKHVQGFLHGCNGIQLLRLQITRQDWSNSSSIGRASPVAKARCRFETCLLCKFHHHLKTKNGSKI